MIFVTEPEEATNGRHDVAPLSSTSLEELVAELKCIPSRPEDILPGSGLLGIHLANPITPSDPDFDVDKWNQAWDQMEARMKADDLAHEQAELQALLP